jgi:DNA-binding GntR family transcriptional regulator
MTAGSTARRANHRRNKMAQADAGRQDGKSAARSETAVGRVYEALRGILLSYEIKPSERLNEVELARRFRVSRTPLREALNRLVTERLLSFEPLVGFFRPAINLQEVRDLYEFRVILETIGIRLAIQRASDAEISAVSEFWTNANRNGASLAKEELIHIDEQFHEALIGLSHNQELVHALRAVNARIHVIRWADTSGDGRHEESYRQHHRLLDVLRERKEAQCVEVLRGIIERRQEEIVEVIKEGAVRLYVT